MVTGWERNNRTHFDDIVLQYDFIRPKYPEELFNDIIEFTKANRTKVALEIGAGTGIATLPFLKAGFTVTAIDIGVNMVEHLKNKFNDFKNFSVINSAFEDAVLIDNIYDLIYAGTAFHWVDAEIGCPKVFKLLKNGGVVALFRYNMFQVEGERTWEKFQPIYEKHYYSYYTTTERPKKIPKADYFTPLEIKKGYRFESLKDYGFTDITNKLYDVSATYNADDYITLLETMSDHRNLPEENRTALNSEIRDTILNHGGSINIDWVFQLYMGRKI